jgi:phosphoglycerol transferase MdoB-like AlkP superfamily enzyme
MRESVRRFGVFLFPGRLRVLLAPAAGFLILNAVVRIALAAMNGDPRVLLPWRLLPVMLVGLLFDATVATAFLAPLALTLTLWPQGERATRILAFLLGALLFPFSVLMVFVGAAEFTFWNEFSSRFNFIAVDYLVYTNEVIGNIRESYNLPVVFSAIAVVAIGIWWALWRQGARRLLVADPSAGGRSWRSLLVWLLLPVLLFPLVDSRWKEVSPDGRINELAGNGYWDFVHAFRYNEIDYDRFYRTLPPAEALAELEHEIDRGGERTDDHLHPYWRDVAGSGKEKRLNVVMISVESLSASFVGALGNPEGFTPNLDRLAADGLLFTRVYATGLRTVRGLEALTLSVPPTPGNSIVKRPNNSNLFSIGEVFRERGYESIYAYGGYGYFDNMNAFFGGNGYTVIDRTALAANEVTQENIWGVADEDLFRHTLRELDRRAAAGTPFFAHVMTTSNHRPFTYPEGRIDIPSGKSRMGAVKYSDWAIGNFVDEARRRPWFRNTLFVIVADHTHKGRGRIELPLENYHIPLIVYSPGNVAPGRIDTIASQMDVPPTILGILGFRYRSRFFGQDILRVGPEHPRAFMANYQTVGYYEDGVMIELRPNRAFRIVDAATGRERPLDALGGRILKEAISYYQVASQAFERGELRISQAEVAGPKGPGV